MANEDWNPMWALRHIGLLIIVSVSTVNSLSHKDSSCTARGSAGETFARQLPQNPKVHDLCELRLSLRGGGVVDRIYSSWRGWWGREKQGSEQAQKDFRRSDSVLSAKRTASPADLSTDPPSKRGRVEPVTMSLHGGGKHKKKHNKQVLSEDVEPEAQVEGPPLTSTKDLAATVQANAGEASLAALGEPADDIHLTDVASALDATVSASDLLKQTKGVSSSGNCMYMIEKVG